MIAGCDGFHGICRPTIPDGVLRTFSRDYPFGWLGILAAVAPSNDELVYAHHERGFALLSLRSPELSRLYIQCRPDEDIDDVAGRPDLGGAAAAARDRRLDAGRGPGAREGRDGHAQLRRRAHAVRPPLPRGRCRAHRAADGREGPQPRDRGREAAGRGARSRYRTGSTGPARPLLGVLPAPRLARRAFLLVDDVDAAPAARARSVRSQAAALAAPLRVRTSAAAATTLAENYVGLPW